MAGRASQLGHNAVTVTNSATQIVGFNGKRQSLVIRNDTGGAANTETLYVGSSSAVTTANGFPVPVGGSLTIENCQSAVFGIRASASEGVRYLESSL